ncbi:MAG: ABC transporter substrate-binding protein [Lautropia sp.]
MNRRHYLAALATAALGAFAGLAPQAHAQDGEIVFAATLPLTSPFAAVAKDQLGGMKDYLDWVNAQGGVHSRKIRFVVEDTQYKVDLAIAGFKKFMASDKPVAVFGDGTGFVRTAAQENNERFKVMMTSTSFASDLQGGPYGYHFMPGPTYSESVSVLLQYVKQAYKGSGKPRLAVIHSESEYGRDPLEFIRRKAADLNIDLVLVSGMKFRDVDVVAETIKLRQARPDFTIIHGFGGAPIFTEVIKLAKDYDIRTTFMGTFWESARTTLKRAGAAADGFVGVSYYAWNTAGQSAPVLKAIDEIRRKRDSSYDGFPDIYYMQGWMSAMLMVKGAQATLDAGRPLTGESMRDALRSLVDWDTGGVIGAPVTFVNNTIPMAQLVRFDAKQGMLPVPITGWIKVR